MKILNHQGNKKSIAIYLILAYGITWVLWLPGLILGLREGYIMPTLDTYHILWEKGFENEQHRWLSIAFFMGVYGPLLGGFSATWLEKGKKGISEWWSRITKWKIKPRWYWIALLITILLAAVPVSVLGLVNGFTANKLALWYLAVLLLIQLLGSGLGEEPGWRGFLLPRLKNRLTDDNYIWLLGLIWSGWHFPIIIIQTLSMVQHATIPQLVITILMSLAGNVMALIGITYLYVWMYNKTESVFLSIVFHAFSNGFVFWFSSYLAAPQTAVLPIALMPWAVVLILQKTLGEEHFPG